MLVFRRLLVSSTIALSLVATSACSVTTPSGNNSGPQEKEPDPEPVVSVASEAAPGEKLQLSVEKGEFVSVELTDDDHKEIPVDAGTFETTSASADPSDPATDSASDPATDNADSDEDTDDSAEAGGNIGASSQDSENSEDEAAEETDQPEDTSATDEPADDATDESSDDPSADPDSTDATGRRTRWRGRQQPQGHVVGVQLHARRLLVLHMESHNRLTRRQDPRIHRNRGHS